MAHGHFLVRNRHNNTWYGRVTIPQSLRPLFNDRREIRQSLGTPDKQRAKRLSRLFWVQCQAGFERLQQQTSSSAPFTQSSAFIEWLSQNNKIGPHRDAMAYYIETFDVMGRKHVIDLDNPEQEKELALQLQANAAAILDRYKDQPAILERLLNLNTALLTPENKPETPTSFHDAVEAYFDKLSTQGRKGKKLAPRTLLHYKDKLTFWQQHFGSRKVHTLTLKELGDIQNWLTRLPSNLTKKGLTVEKAVKLAQGVSSEYPTIADKTRAEYIGQLKGILEYA